MLKESVAFSLKNLFVLACLLSLFFSQVSRHIAYSKEITDRHTLISRDEDCRNDSYLLRSVGANAVPEIVFGTEQVSNLILLGSSIAVLFPFKNLAKLLDIDHVYREINLNSSSIISEEKSVAFGDVYSCDVSGDNNWFAYKCSPKDPLRLIDLETKIQRSFPRAKRGDVYPLASNRNRLLTRSNIYSVDVYDIAQKKLVSIKTESGYVNALDVTEKHVAVAREDGTILVWRLSDRKLIQRFFSRHSGVFGTTAIKIVDDKIIISSGDYVTDDKSIEIWSLKTGSRLKTKRVSELHYSPSHIEIYNNKLMITEGSGEGSQEVVWSLPDLTKLWSFTKSDLVYDNGLLYVANGTKQITVYDLSTKKRARSLSNFDSDAKIFNIELNKDHLVVLDDKGKTYFVDKITGEIKSSFRLWYNHRWIKADHIYPYISSNSSLGLEVWNIEDKKKIFKEKSFYRHNFQEILNSGKIVTAGYTQKVELWDVKKNKLLSSVYDLTHETTSADLGKSRLSIGDNSGNIISYSIQKNNENSNRFDLTNKREENIFADPIKHIASDGQNKVFITNDGCMHVRNSRKKQYFKINKPVYNFQLAKDGSMLLLSTGTSTVNEEYVETTNYELSLFKIDSNLETISRVKTFDVDSPAFSVSKDLLWFSNGSEVKKTKLPNKF